MKKLLVGAWICFPVCLSAGLAGPVLADDDAEKYAALRKQAEARIAETANEVATRAEAQKQDVEARLAKVRTWTQSQFELGERKIIDKPRAIAAVMKHWQTQRENELYRLLQFPDKSNGSIESGQALNALMESVGPAALQNAEIRKIKPEEALPLCSASQYRKIDGALAAAITWQENILGAKLVGQGDRCPLELDWPAILREERWQEQRQRCDSAVQQVMEEISTSSGLTAKSDAELRDAIAALNADFANYRAEWVRGEYPDGDRAREYRRICDGKRHIEKLVMGAYQLVELSRYQVAQREPFRGGTIEDYLAYFQRNNLRFAPAAPANRSAYHQVFEMMVRYYLDQKMAANIERDLEKELADLKQTDKDSVDAALGRTMNAPDQALVQAQDRVAVDNALNANPQAAQAPAVPDQGAGPDAGQPPADAGPAAGDATTIWVRRHPWARRDHPKPGPLPPKPRPPVPRPSKKK